jgi:hypothetical protein
LASSAPLGLQTLAAQQSRDTRESIAIANRSAETAERALVTIERSFVFLIELNFDSMSWTGGRQIVHLQVKPIWRNSGSTPTRNLSIRVNWAHCPISNVPPEIGTFKDIDPTKMFLAPQAQEWTEAINIPPAIATRALNQEVSIFIWGQADYEDIFDGTSPRFTQWCNRLNFTVSGAPSIAAVAYSDFNRSDEDARQKRSRDK